MATTLPPPFHRVFLWKNLSRGVIGTRPAGGEVLHFLLHISSELAVFVLHHSCDLCLWHLSFSFLVCLTLGFEPMTWGREADTYSISFADVTHEGNCPRRTLSDYYPLSRFFLKWPPHDTIPYVRPPTVCPYHAQVDRVTISHLSSTPLSSVEDHISTQITFHRRRRTDVNRFVC